jgi:hypothetical protein
MEQSHLIEAGRLDGIDGSESADAVFARVMTAFLLVDLALVVWIFNTWDALARHPVLYTVAAILGSIVVSLRVGATLRAAA